MYSLQASMHLYSSSAFNLTYHLCCRLTTAQCSGSNSSTPVEIARAGINGMELINIPKLQNACPNLQQVLRRSLLALCVKLCSR